MRKPNAKQAAGKSKPRVSSAREQDIISEIERINEELVSAPEPTKLYLINKRRRLEAMVLDSAFSHAFDTSVEMVKLEKELPSASDHRKAHIERKLRRLAVKITPWKKQRAAEDKRQILTMIYKYIRQYGAPVNNTEFMRRLRDDGVLTKVRLGRKWPISDTTVRAILRSVVGKGQRGRKPAAQNSE